MAHHKSAKKRIRSTERKREINKAVTSRIKTSTKKVLSSNNKEEAEKSYKEAVSVLDRSVDKGKIKKNTAARKKSQLTRHLNSLAPTETVK
jgi:small subunit ribosomal protein S20